MFVSAFPKPPENIATTMVIANDKVKIVITTRKTKTSLEVPILTDLKKHHSKICFPTLHRYYFASIPLRQYKGPILSQTQTYVY